MTSVSGAYLLNPISLLLAFCGLGCSIICVYLFQFKRSPGIRYLSMMEAANALWCVFYTLEYSAADLSVRLFWSKLSYFGILFTTLYFYFFTLRFFRKKPLSMRFRVVLVLLSLIPITGVLTNDYHHLHWQSASIDVANNTTIYQYGPLFWVTFLYTYSFLVLGIVNIFRLIREGPRQIHRSLWLIITACLIPVAGNILYVFKINPVPGFDWTPICFLLSGILLTYINLRHNTFDLLPFAREKMIEIWEDGVLVVDQHLRIADFNRAFLHMTGKARKDLLGGELLRVLPGQKDLVKEIVTQNGFCQKEIELKDGGEKKILEIRSTPLMDRNKVWWGASVVIRDITFRKQNEAAIIQANAHLKKEISEKEKLISDLNSFAHTVAHDLRDTIGAVVSLSDLIKTEIEELNYTNVAALNDIVFESANKTMKIIKELLVMATVREGNIVFKEVDMGKVIAECEFRLGEMIRQTKATILKPDTWPVVQANAAWLEEVWVNYMANALKYGGTPPVVELGAEKLPGENKVKFWIRDNGNGIPAEEQGELFKQFSRLGHTEAAGSGLGLSIVKRIIEKLGGQAGVFSNAVPGEGSLFYFILPS